MSFALNNYQHISLFDSLSFYQNANNKYWVNHGQNRFLIIFFRISMIKEYLENAETAEETSCLITDGAYAGEEAATLSAGKNIKLLTTGLLGRKPKEILDQFELDENNC